MADLLDKGSKWLGRQRREHAAQEVVYLRGGSSVGVPATIGQTDFQRDDGNGFPLTFQSVDFLITAADLVLDGIPVTPERGDQVITGRIDEGVVYELMDNLGGPAWKYADAYRRVYRIHTKQVATRP